MLAPWTARARLSSSAVLLCCAFGVRVAAQDARALASVDAGVPDAAAVSQSATASGVTDAPSGVDAGAAESQAPPPATALVSPGAIDLGGAQAGNSQPTQAPIRYLLEAVQVRGNHTRAEVVTNFVTVKVGDHFDVDDPSIEDIRWRLLGTGWFDDVKLSLERGSRRGAVVLLIEVKERNTLLVDRLVMGLSRSVQSSTTRHDSLRPYAGLGLVEMNLLGLGIGVSASGVYSAQQYGLNFGYHDPTLAGSGFSLTGRVFHNYAREFFGRNPLVAISCESQGRRTFVSTCDPDVEGKRAVVIYHRTGVGFGTGHEISSHLRYTLDWLGEYVDVLSKPDAASTQRGSEIVPIDFRIEGGASYVSSFRLGLIYDARDHPALTTRGDYAELGARIGSRVVGSNYDFARFELTFRHWFPLPWNHVVSLGVFAGSVFGDAPFFYNFYAADLSDLLPSRVLELNLDRRRTPNLLGTSIVEMDMEDLAARLDLEYQLPLQRGGGFVRGVDAYLGAGVFLLSRRQDLRVAIAGYHGLARVPLDVTFDLGVQADTEIGLFKIGFSSLIGFSPIGRENP